MRKTMIALPLFAGLVAMPAAAQVSARIHVDIPVGRPGVAYGEPRQQLAIREYDRGLFGDWDNYYDQWIPETVYYYDGYYYDYPIVAYAQPVIVYRFHNQRFFAPRQREFISWQQRFRGNDYRRDFDRRPIERNDRDDRRFVQPPRDYRNDRGGRDDRDRRDVQPVQPRGGDRGGREVRPAQPEHNDRGGRPAQPSRDAGRSRSRPH